MELGPIDKTEASRRAKFIADKLAYFLGICENLKSELDALKQQDAVRQTFYGEHPVFASMQAGYRRKSQEYIQEISSLLEKSSTVIKKYQDAEEQAQHTCEQLPKNK